MNRRPPPRRPPASSKPPATKPAAPPVFEIEAEVVEGIEEIAAEELRRRFGASVQIGAARRTRTGPVNLPFTFAGNPKQLLKLRTVSALFLVQYVPEPRPRGILANHHFRDLLQQIAAVRAFVPDGSYQTFYLSAAGSDSPELVRLRDALAIQTGLDEAEGEGDLYLRLRRPPDGSEGWEVLIRLTPRPLATRPWRVRNRAGALNATVAHAMVLLTEPTTHDVFVNLGCGSGTLLIERREWGAAMRTVGCDTDPIARDDAAANLAASGYAARIEITDWDARAVPLPDRSADALVADLPFGIRMGAHADNVPLYPAMLAEAARLARDGARLVVITSESRLMESVLARQEAWHLERTLRIGLNGLYPRCYVLRRV